MLCRQICPHFVDTFASVYARGHITLFQVRYTNQVLAASGTLLGKDLRIYYNSDDLRTVRAFLQDGKKSGS